MHLFIPKHITCRIDDKNQHSECGYDVSFNYAVKVAAIEQL